MNDSHTHRNPTQRLLTSDVPDRPTDSAVGDDRPAPGSLFTPAAAGATPATPAAEPHAWSTAQPPTLPGAEQGPPSGPAKGPRPPRRGPGWGGVIAVGAGAAMLSSVLTAGLLNSGQSSGADTASGTRPAASSTTAGSTGQAAPPAANNVTSPDWALVAKNVAPSVVAVKISQNGQKAGEGSGILLDTQGHIVTNAHVVSTGSSNQISVVLSDGRTYPVTVLGSDVGSDIAVVKIDNPPSDLAPATFADSNTVQVGQPVMALGNPLGLADTATTGIVSAVDRPVIAGGQSSGPGRAAEQSVTNAIQTDAAINPGNSGGALVDAQGQVIGITSSIASLGSSGGQAGSIGLGFAIPSSTAQSIAQEIISSGKASHAFLGVTVDDTQVSVDGAVRQAALITSVSAGDPAAEAGIQAQDAVTALDGEPVESADSLVARIRELKPGTEVRLTVVREGTSQETTVTLAERPAP